MSATTAKGMSAVADLFEFKLADIGEGVQTATIVRWLVEEGQAVRMDEPLVLVETDKVTAELPSPVVGVVDKLLAAAGDTVEVGAGLLKIRTGAGASASQQSQGTAAVPAPSATTVARERVASAAVADSTAAGKSADTVKSRAPVDGGGQPAAATGARVRATPYVRHLARQLSVDLTTLQGTGRNGRISEEDVRHQAGGTKSDAVASQSGRGTVQAAPGADVERIPFRGIRQKIAEHMVMSVRTIPHVTHMEEIEMDALMDVLKKAKPHAEQKGTRLTLLAYVAKAMSMAVRDYPLLNSSLDEAAGEILVKHRVNVGIATDTEAGLLVPVVQNVGAKSVLQVASDIQVLTEKARLGKLGLGETAGGTITISNMGGIGSIHATPIIRHPEVAILALHKMEPRVVVRNDEPVIRKMMNVSLSFDHRLLDGATAVRFTNRIKELLEQPELWLLELA